MKDEDKITAAVMRLREFHMANRRERLGQVFLESFQDTVRPRTDKGTLRISRTLLLLATIGLLASATFLFFSFVQR